MTSIKPSRVQKPAKYQFTSAFRYYSCSAFESPSMRTSFLTTFQKVLEEQIPTDLKVQITNIEFRKDQRLSISLDGKNLEDLQFVAAIMKDLIGETIDAHNVPKNTPLYGSLQSIGKVGFGIFIDIGVQNPPKEILIPLFVLRNQLMKDEGASVHEIIQKYGMMDNLPVKIEITSIKFDENTQPRYEGKFTDQFLTQLKEWILQGQEILFSVGVPRQKIKKTIAKRGHTQDITEILRLGPLETAIFCKESTSAPGLMSHIGPYLPNCRFSMIRPAQVWKYWK